MRIWRRCVWLRGGQFCLLVLFAVAPAIGADPKPPELKSVSPAGLQRGTSATIQCEGTFPWPIEVDCPGAKVECQEEKGSLLVSVADDFVGDRLWIRLFDASGASGLLPVLVGDLAEIAEVEPNNSTAGSQVLAEFASLDSSQAVVVNGVLGKAGDLDGYRVSLTAGQTLVAAVDANSAFDSPIDCIMQIARPDGSVVDENHDAVGLDPRIAFTATEAGDYIVRVFAWPAKPNQSIRYHGEKDCVYRLTLTTGPYVTHARQMFVDGGDAPRNFQRDDLVGWNLPKDFSIQSAVFEASADGGLPELESSSVVDTRASAFAFLSRTGVAGRVRLRSVHQNVVPKNGETQTAAGQRIAVGSVLGDSLVDSGASDTFVIPLSKDDAAVVSVESLSMYSALVPRVKLLDPKGGLVAQSGHKGAAVEAKFVWTAKMDGDYRLVISDRFGGGGRDYFYRLTIAESQADFELELQADAFLLESGQELKIPVKIVRNTGAGTPIGPITIQAVLPPGVECESVVSEPTGDSAKEVTLTLVSTGDPFSGAVRIRGMGAEGTVERFATTPTKLGVCFDRAWLTVQ